MAWPVRSQLVKGGSEYPRINAYVDVFVGRGVAVFCRLHVPRWLAHRIGWLE